MKLHLNEKTYIAPPAKAKMFRKALVITKEYDLENISPDTLDELLHFVCEVFGSKFDLEDVYEHLESADLIPLVTDSIQFVVGKAEEGDTKKNDKDPYEMIKEMYFKLMEAGFSMNEIDEMDIHFYFDVMDSQTKKNEVFIDDIW